MSSHPRLSGFASVLGSNSFEAIGEALHACDFFAVESLGMFGTVRIMVFFVIEPRTRAVHIGGMRINPDGAWMMQIARSLLDPEDGFLRSATHLIHDHDPLFTNASVELLKSRGVESVRIPASSPNCSPHPEKFVRTVRTKCLNHFVIFGERHLRTCFASSFRITWKNGFIKVWVAH